MKIKALSTEALNALILSPDSDPFDVMNEVHRWEMVNDRKFIYPAHKPKKIMYVHPDFGWVPELR